MQIYENYLLAEHSPIYNIIIHDIDPILFPSFYLQFDSPTTLLTNHIGMRHGRLGHHWYTIE